MTPDEVIHRELHGISERDFESVAKIGSKGTVFMSIGQVTIGGKIRGQNVSFTQRHSDGVILCLSNSFSEAVMERLHKTACVEIPNWKRLLATISEQLGIFGIGRAVEYTVSTDRNHFLKSIEDKWQDEFRIFWSLPAAVTIKIPSGIALPKHNGAQAK